MRARYLIATVAATALIGIASAGRQGSTPIPTEFEADRLPTIKTNGTCLIRNGRVYTITRGTLDNADVLIVDGKIRGVGKGLAAPAGATVIDATGKLVFPGFIDAHTHRGQDDTNEGGDSISVETSIRDVLNPNHVNVYHNLADGITTALGLHGSANAMGGQSVVFKNKYLSTPEAMIHPGAPRMVKFALGENVTQKWNNQNTRYPRSRMGVETVYRRAFEDAKAYMQTWTEYNVKPIGAPPRRDLRLEAIADILRGNIWVTCHSYRQDEMLMMVRLSQEYGFKLASLTHALEGYKIAPELAAAKVPASLFAESWSYKLEVMGAIPMAPALLLRAGVITSVNTDTFGGVPPLHLDAGKAMRYGISEIDALKMLTLYPAIQTGVERYTGSIEVGKDGDICIWEGHPLSVYSRAWMTLIDGRVQYQRRDAFGVDKLTKFRDQVTTTDLKADLRPLPKRSSTYAIVGGTIHPIVGQPVPNGTVVISNGTITAVGKNVAVPSGATVVRADGQHVYPGFIDAGSNLGLNEIGQVNASQDAFEMGQFKPDIKALISVNPESTHIPIARAWGVTTALVKPAGGTIPGQGGLMSLGGYTREEMAVVPGKSIGAKDPIPHATLHINMPDAPGFGQRAGMQDDALETARKNLRESRLVLQEYLDAGKRYIDAKVANPNMAPDPKMEAMIPYLKAQRPVVISANSVNAIRAAIKFGKDNGLKTIISGAAEAWKIAAEVKASNVPVIYAPPGVTNGDTAEGFAEFDPWDTQLVAPYLLWKAGIPFALETNSSSMVFNLPQQAGYLSAFGLPKEEAVKAITINAARILGIGDQLGSIEKGKIANLVVTNGDPLELQAQYEYVFINGQPVSLKNHFTELYRKYEARLESSRK